MNETEARDELAVFMYEAENKPFHVEHVARLSLSLFDQLAPLHGLGPRERLILEGAGRLHDIGHGQDFDGQAHHKVSARMIRERSWKNFSPEEIEIMAQVARYHRKSMPELEHDEFRRLRPEDRRRVQQLAAILRIADSLDRSHRQLVTGLRVELRPNQLIVHLEATGPVHREVRAAWRKGDLAMALFQRDLLFLLGDEPVPMPLDGPGEK